MIAKVSTDFFNECLKLREENVKLKAEIKKLKKPCSYCKLREKWAKDSFENSNKPTVKIPRKPICNDDGY